MKQVIGQGVGVEPVDAVNNPTEGSVLPGPDVVSVHGDRVVAIGSGDDHIEAMMTAVRRHGRSQIGSVDLGSDRGPELAVLQHVDHE